MKRLDLDDLPPKVAQLLSGVEDGEELLLVENGLVVARLVGGPAPEPEAAEDAEAVEPEMRTREIFEQFRSMMEDDF
jgi:antitoxin (DNA-binding transcriptional repressor) of toxin-antitoxin stability system